MYVLKGLSGRLMFLCPQIAEPNEIAGLRNLFILREKMDKALELRDGPQIVPSLHGLPGKVKLFFTINSDLAG